MHREHFRFDCDSAGDVLGCFANGAFGVVQGAAALGLDAGTCALAKGCEGVGQRLDQVGSLAETLAACAVPPALVQATRERCQSGLIDPLKEACGGWKSLECASGAALGYGITRLNRSSSSSSATTPDAPSGLSPSSIRFSQSSVNNVDEIARNMRANGWVGDPIDVVRMPDGSLATLDNTRVLAAHQAGIDVQATVRAFDDPLTAEMAERFATPTGGVPSTWGEAIANRIGNQNAGYRTAWSDGSPVTGWDGN